MGFKSAIMARIRGNRTTSAPTGFNISSPQTAANRAATFLGSPEIFLANNLLLVPGGVTSAALDNTAYDMMLIEKPRSRVSCTYRGQSVDVVFAIPKASYLKQRAFTGIDLNIHFKSFYCPYDNDEVKGTMISNAGDYVLTAAMDGCSFGVGSETADGSGARLVFHANAITASKRGANVSQSKAQTAMLKNKLTDGVDAILKPRQYRGGADQLSSTTFGVRDTTTGTWKFYSQTYTQISSTPDCYELRGLDEFA